MEALTISSLIPGRCLSALADSVYYDEVGEKNTCKVWFDSWKKPWVQDVYIAKDFVLVRQMKLLFREQSAICPNLFSFNDILISEAINRMCGINLKDTLGYII